MTSASSTHYDLAALQALTETELTQLNWRDLNCYSGALLEMHAEGKLGNESFAKLPRKPILCIDQIDWLDEERIEASFQFPEQAREWPFDPAETLEMLFQDQLDQLVGFWGARKLDGIGRALSSGRCVLHSPLKFEPAKILKFELEKRKWITTPEGGGTAVFTGKILDDSGEVILESKNVIVGILNPEDIINLRKQFGGQSGVAELRADDQPKDLMVPIYDTDLGSKTADDGKSLTREAVQAISPDLWPFRYHFRDDPVVPGNFGTHGMIALLKKAAIEDFGLSMPVFKSMQKKSFSGMIFEDPKQIRFCLNGLTKTDDGDVVAAEASLFLENADGTRMIEEPIYTFKGLTVTEG